MKIGKEIATFTENKYKTLPIYYIGCCVLSLATLLESYEKQGYSIKNKRKTKLAQWTYLEKEGGKVAFHGDIVYLYHVEGDVKLAHVNDFLKRYRNVYEKNFFDSKDQGILSYTGSLNTREFRKVAQSFLERDQYRRMKVKQIKSAPVKETKTEPRSRRVNKEEIKKQGTIERERKETVSEDVDVSIKTITQSINKWRRMAPKVTGRRREKLMTLSMTGFLSSTFQNIVLEQNLGGNRIDAVIGKIGIEAKYRPDQNEINRLYGQVDDYLRFMDHIIVVFFDTNQAEINNFRRKITSGGYRDKVTLISV